MYEYGVYAIARLEMLRLVITIIVFSLYYSFMQCKYLYIQNFW